MWRDVVELLGWTLLHFVWQGLVVGLIAAVVLAAMRRRSANARYLTGVVALSVMSVLPPVTLGWLYEPPSPFVESPIVMWKSYVEVPDPTSETGTTTAERFGIDFENPPPPDAIPIRLEPAPESDPVSLPFGLDRWSWQPALPWIVSVWLAGVVVLSVRLLFSWLHAQRLRRRSSQPADDRWQALLRHLAERMRVTRPVQLVESALVEVPAVIGWLRPVILLPASAMTGLTAEQLEALLAHELAHVRRYDYLVNLLQTVVETLLFYHPAVWWLSHRIRVEREHCCDDLAVQVCGNGLTYAKALVALEELRAPKLGLAMSSSGGSLLTRVARLLGQAEQQRRPTGWIAGLLSLVLLTMAGALGAGLLTPPEKPTAGLPNATQPTPTKSTDTNEETSGPTQRRGQETRAERKAPVSKHGQFVGRVRLKTEKVLPDLSNVKLPPGKILDESLVFSKEGGLANVFVYWRRPPEVRVTVVEVPERKPFVLTASGGRFMPRAAVTLVGQPLEFVNTDKSPLNFRTAPIKNAPENRLVAPESSVSVPAFNAAENLPVQVGSNIYPWMSAWVFPLDHPFAAVTDAEGRFSIDGLPPGEHEFRLWHEGVGYLNKKLVVTIKSGEETRSELEYEPSRFGLSDDALRAWSRQVIDVEKLAVPRPKVPPMGTTPTVSQRDPTVENADRRIRQELTKLTEVDFIDTPLNEVMTFLGDYHNIPMVFDASVKELLKDPADAPITATLTGEDLATVLRRVLHSVKLSYFVADGKLQIATPDAVKKRGLPVPESLDEVIAKLEKADASVPWTGFFSGSGVDQAGAPVTSAANLERLTKLLTHSDVVVQRHAAAALTWFGKQAVAARPALEKLTSSEDRAVRRAAWQVLLSIGNEDLSTWPLFLAAWVAGDDVVQSDWFHTLQQFDPEVFVRMRKMFPTASVEVRRLFAASIRIRGHDELTEPLALLAFADEDRTVRNTALQSSRHELTPAMLEGLRPRLQDEFPPCRVTAAERLLSSPDDRTAAFDVLLQELAREDSNEKGHVLSILASRGREHGAGSIRDRLLRRSVSASEPERLAARSALRLVPEDPNLAGALKHIDLIFESRKNQLVLSAPQRVQAAEVDLQDMVTRNNPSEELRARVHHRAALGFGNWDIRQQFAFVAKHAEAGLRLDVDPARRASLYSLLGSAALVNSETKTFAEQRRNAAMFWLSGYHEVASLKLPKIAPELPVVEKFGFIEGESLEQESERRQRHAAQVEARRQAEFLRTMIEHRHQLARLLIETYQRAPADEIELRMLAKEALIDKSLIEALLAEGAVPLGATVPSPKGSGEQLQAQAIERGIAFLKAQQQENGTWQGQPVDGVTALCAAALRHAGMRADDPVMRKALAHLRNVEPTLSYTVALQTMVFCWTSPKEDAELIKRNVAWLEKAQVADGKSRGSWSYVVNPGGRGDGSCSRFAVLGLDAAKRAGFEVKEETWKRVSDYWLTSQRENGGWGYTPESGPTPTMTLAGIAGLATANRHLPQDDQTKKREAAIRKPTEYLEKWIPEWPRAFYSLQSLERAGHLSGLKEFGKLDWKADAMKRLLEMQQANGSWKGNTQTESELVATSFALLVLTGQPQPKLVGYRLRFEPRDAGKKFEMQSSLIENSSPPMQRTVLSGGVRIEFLKSDGLKCRIEADRAIIESNARTYEELEMNSVNDVMRIECIGSVKCEDRRGDGSTQLTAEHLWFDVRRNLIQADKGGNSP